MLSKAFAGIPIVAVLLAGITSASAAQLSTDARAAIPYNVRQLLVVDYKDMQNSTAATELRNRVMPPELKPFDEALQKSGLNDDHDVDQLAFVLFRPKDAEDKLESVGIAQGQFPLQHILASFRKQRIKPTVVRADRVYPLAKTGMVACFLDPSTMVFGDMDAVQASLAARDGQAPSLLTNQTMTDAMKSVDTEPLWSILDEKGTQFMVHQLLGNAGSVTDFDTVKMHLQSCRYGMDFQHGVQLHLSIGTGDNFIAATLSAILNAAINFRKATAQDAEKQALAATTIRAMTGDLEVQFATSDDTFASLLKSPLFQSVLA